MATGRVLYYPYTHFRDSSWLKVAALYYEGIARMIPEQFRPDDSEDVRALTQAGFLEKHDTAPSAEAIADEFIKYAKEFLGDEKRRKKLFPELATSGSGFRIQPGKLADRVREVLKDLHPQQELPKVGDDFDLDAMTGGVYMAFLARRMSSDLGMSVATHEPVFQRLIYKPVSEKEIKEPGVAESTIALASLVIRSAVPTEPESIPIDSVLKFREKHEAARREFFDAIGKIGGEINVSVNDRILTKFLQDKQKIVDQKVEHLEKAMRDVGITTAQNFLLFSVPSWVTAKWALNLETGTIPIAGASLSALITLYRGYREVKKVKRENPWAYVLSLRKLKRRSWRQYLGQRDTTIRLFSA
jgi:hypothetical protein